MILSPYLNVSSDILFREFLNFKFVTVYKYVCKIAVLQYNDGNTYLFTHVQGSNICNMTTINLKHFI